MQGRFDAYIEHIWNQYILGLQTPLPKLFTTPGFTEASAKAAIEVVERKVQAIQRFVKRIVERQIFVSVVSQAGIDPTEAKCARTSFIIAILTLPNFLMPAGTTSQILIFVIAFGYGWGVNDAYNKLLVDWH